MISFIMFVIGFIMFWGGVSSGNWGTVIVAVLLMYVSELRKLY